jgi:hypothetical protein
VKFSNIPNSIKAWATAFVALAAVFALAWGWIGYLHTDAEAQEHVEDFQDYQMQQFKSDKYDRADRIQREIDRIDFQLLSDDLLPRERNYLENKRADLVNKIVCIQRDEC